MDVGDMERERCNVCIMTTYLLYSADRWYSRFSKNDCITSNLRTDTTPVLLYSAGSEASFCATHNTQHTMPWSLCYCQRIHLTCSFYAQCGGAVMGAVISRSLPSIRIAQRNAHHRIGGDHHRWTLPCHEHSGQVRPMVHHLNPCTIGVHHKFSLINLRKRTQL